ncbi:MAG: hypothetical protein GKS06_18900 [Acidobacteria bacterium]|nr:hypothetical protein [Acidobacteriota bacterium]
MGFRDELERLVRLQATELQARDLQAQLGGLPAEREECQARVSAAEAGVADAEASRDAAQAEHRRLEGELQAAEAQVDKYREQEMQVRTNQQLWAIQDEIKTVQGKISKIEEQILELMEAADGLSDGIKAAQDVLGAAKAETATEIAAIDQREKELGDALAAETNAGNELRAETEPKLITLYDRVATVRGGIAVAEGIDGRCSACNVRLRPQIWVQVLNLVEPQQCDACKRIIFVRDSLSLPSTVSVDANA